MTAMGGVVVELGHHPRDIGVHAERGRVVDHHGARLGEPRAGTPRSAAARREEGDVDVPRVPSGIDSTTGQAPGCRIDAQVTLTLALPKTGLDVATVGELWPADIGISIGVYQPVGIDVPPSLFGAVYRTELTASISSWTDG